MTFLLPLGLLGLLSLPVIVLLHLIRQRRDRVRVPSLQIWRELQRSTVQKQPRRLPLSLLLLLRLLLAALLAFALGQPLLELIRGRATHTAIVIDTSSSMAATDAQPDRIGAARAEALGIIRGLRRGDSAALIELSGEPRVLAQATGSEGVVLQRELDTLRAGGPDGDIESALSLAQATARPDADLAIVVLTDQAFRSSAAPTVAGDVAWRTFGEQGDNVAIVAFAARPLRNGQQQLYARVANLGSSPIARTLQLDLDGTRAASEPMRLAPGAEAEWSWPLPHGTTRAQASMTGSDVQPIDDRAAVIVGDSVQARVQVVSSETTPLERALRAQRGLAVERISPAEYRASTAADLVVFNRYLPQQLPDAPVLVVAPPADAAIFTVSGSTDVEAPAAARDERFAPVDLRAVSWGSVAQIDTPAWASVAVAAGDLPLVLTGQFNNHPIAIWTFDPQASNLANRLAFPLLTAATTGALMPQPNSQLPLGAPAPFALRGPDGTVAAGDRLTQPGVYEAESGAGSIAVNALDADEATLAAREAPQITTIARPDTESDEPVGRELWKPLVMIGLAILAIEWIAANRPTLRRRAGARA